ncbi:MAG: hypothetical protein AB7G93_02515 [Bdellovibrionales bacterium]
MTLTRRDLLRGTAVTAGVLIFPAFSRAQATAPKLIVTADIQFNHGHALALSADDLVLLLREAEKTGGVSVNIQGQSNHPHAVVLSAEALMTLLSGGEISLASTQNAGHSHGVTIRSVEA